MSGDAEVGPPLSAAEDTLAAPTTPKAGEPEVEDRAPEVDDAASEVADTADAAAVPLSFSVQLGAFRERARAETVRQRAADRGLEARIVRLPDSQLHYVRIGRFGTQTEASALQARLTQLGFRTFVVRDADEELPTG